MADKNDYLRDLATVRRNMDKLEEQAATANGAMPSGSRPADGGRQNYQVVLKRLEALEELVGETADRLRTVLKKMDD